MTDTPPTRPLDQHGRPVDLHVSLLAHTKLAVPALLFLPVPRERAPADGRAAPWRLGDTAPGNPAETWGQWAQRKWSETTSGLHRIVYEGAAGAFSGVVVPTEIKDPAAASAYLAFTYQKLGDAFGWPVDQAATAQAAMKAAGNAATVVDTIARLRPLGPPMMWPGAPTWYAIADDMGRSAALVSAGEAASAVRQGAVSYADDARQLAAALGQKLDRLLDVGNSYGTGAGIGIGTAVGLVGGGIALYVAWPFIAGGRVAASAAAARA